MTATVETYCVCSSMKRLTITSVPADSWLGSGNNNPPSPSCLRTPTDVKRQPIWMINQRSGMRLIYNVPVLSYVLGDKIRWSE